MPKQSDDKRARWLNILENFSQSGQTISAYCNEHSISVATFSYWKKKLLHESQEVPEFVQIVTFIGSVNNFVSLVENCFFLARIKYEILSEGSLYYGYC